MARRWNDASAVLRSLQEIGIAVCRSDCGRIYRSIKLSDGIELCSVTSQSQHVKSDPRIDIVQLQKFIQETFEKSQMVGLGLVHWMKLLRNGVTPGSGGQSFVSSRRVHDRDDNQGKIFSEKLRNGHPAGFSGRNNGNTSSIRAFHTSTHRLCQPNQQKNRTRKYQRLSENSRESAVPSSRVGRLANYGGLAVGLGVGALAEVTRKTFGLSNGDDAVKSALGSDNPFLTEANAERIVGTLCRVRGAALKIGQMLSIQDSAIISPELQKIFERVRDSADFMPTRQVEKVLKSEFGEEWKEKLKDFDEKPFAAASIGQVHRGVTKEGREVALKIQYPGVAKSINSDINNLMSVMNIGNLIPKGLYLDSFVVVARQELALECDYFHEAAASKKFRTLLDGSPGYYVPEVIDDLTTKQILTTELVSGVPLDKCVHLDQETRDWLGHQVLSLCLRELFHFNYMQTDPNWSNFFFDESSPERRLILLDFGASRAYKKTFVETYMRIIKAASDGDREAVLKYSRKIGFLTGYESKLMNDAHCNAVLILGEPLGSGERYDFGAQDITRRMQKVVPVMLDHRLTPPPEEIYSLHRKLSGAFLSCAKLGSRVWCKPIFDDIYANFDWSE